MLPNLLRIILQRHKTWQISSKPCYVCGKQFQLCVVIEAAMLPLHSMANIVFLCLFIFLGLGRASPVGESGAQKNAAAPAAWKPKAETMARVYDILDEHPFIDG